MPDDPIQDNQDQTTSQPEPQPEESKPVEGNPTPEELTAPEPPKEEAPTETPAETPKEEPKPEEKPAEEPKTEEPKPDEEQPKAEEKEAKSRTESPQGESGTVIIKEVPVEVIKEVKVVDEAELGKQLDEKFKEKLMENKKKADEARSQKRKDNLNQIVELAKKRDINNQDVRDLLQVSQSTATNYLTELAKSGRLKSEGKAKAKDYKS